MSRLVEIRQELVKALLDHYGDFPKTRCPAPGSGSFASVLAGALGLITEDRVASHVLEVLRDADLIEAAELASADALELESLFKQNHIRLKYKSFKPIHLLARWTAERGISREEGLRDIATQTLREEWRSIPGIGPAMLDALLLFAADRPAFPLDRATYRILLRHGWIGAGDQYDEAQEVALSIAPEDLNLLKQVSKSMERLGRDYCKVGLTRCEVCPLRTFLPEGGPLGEN